MPRKYVQKTVSIIISFGLVMKYNNCNGNCNKIFQKWNAFLNSVN